MTRDLEETLKELGPGYRGVVDRLTAAYRPIGAYPCTRHAVDAGPCPRQNADVSLLVGRGRGPASTGHIFRWTAGYLVAASLMVFLGVGVLFRCSNAGSPSASARASAAPRVYTVAYATDESALRAIVASQRADGSWANDFITRQNAAALRSATDAVSIVAYKRALRYLRSRGLEPLTDNELRERADFATGRRAT